MTESEEHKMLKIAAKKLLLTMGFKQEDIFEEYVYKINHRYVTIDVAGISTNPKRIIAIECGELSVDKYYILNFVCDKLIHIPYGFNLFFNDFSSITTIENEIRNKMKIEEKKKLQNIERCSKFKIKYNQVYRIIKDNKIISRQKIIKETNLNDGNPLLPEIINSLSNKNIIKILKDEEAMEEINKHSKDWIDFNLIRFPMRGRIPSLYKIINDN